jgi:hypothetical protein
VEKALSSISLFALLNGGFYPKTKVLEKRLVLNPSNLTPSQIFSNKLLINLYLYIKEHKLFTLQKFENENGIRSKKMKILILSLMQEKWKQKTNQLYNKIFTIN